MRAKSELTIAIGQMGLCLGLVTLLCSVTSIACTSSKRHDVAPPTAAVSTAPPVVPTVLTAPVPSCTHEVCGERPKYHRCTAWGTHAVGGLYTIACDVWEIQYEHHCTCDAWGPGLTVRQ